MAMLCRPQQWRQQQHSAEARAQPSPTPGATSRQSSHTRACSVVTYSYTSSEHLLGIRGADAELQTIGV